MATSSDESALLERVFLRVCAAETDEQLENVLAKFLTPTILKLESPTEGIRKKVLELLTHIKKSVSSRALVRLPVRDLIQQYKSAKSSPFVCNFAILYAKIGFYRLTNQEQGKLILDLLDCISDRPQPQQDIFLQLIVTALQHVQHPERGHSFGNIDDGLKSILFNYISEFFYLPYSTATVAETPSGLSPAVYKRLQFDPPLSPDLLMQIKLSIIDLFSRGLFPEELIAAPLLIATADSKHQVVSAAELALKRLSNRETFENAAVVNALFTALQGSSSSVNKTPKPEHKREAASIAVRLKIMPFMVKSTLAANTFPGCVQISFDLLFGASTNAKLKDFAVQFVHHMCNACDDSKFQFSTISAVLLSGMVKLIGEKNEDPKLRSGAYTAVGKLVNRGGSKGGELVVLVTQLVQALSTEPTDVQLSIQAALSTIVPVLKKVGDDQKKLLEALVADNIEQDHHLARLFAVQLACGVFPRDHVSTRYLLLLASGDTKEDVYKEATDILRIGNNINSRDELQLPDFAKMVSYIREKGKIRLKNNKGVTFGTKIIPFAPPVYAEIVMYLRQCLALSAGATPNLESTASMQLQSPAIGRYLRRLLQEPTTEESVLGFVNLLVDLLQSMGGAPAMFCLLEVCAVTAHSWSALLKIPFLQVENFRPFVFAPKEDVREFASQLYAIITINQTSAIILNELEYLRKEMLTGSAEKQHGACLALGRLMGGILVKLNQGELDEEVVLKSKKEISCFVQQCSKLFSQPGSSVFLRLAVVYALGELGRRSAMDTISVAILHDVIAILKMALKDSNPKLTERAVISLGQITINGIEQRKTVMQLLVEAVESTGQQQWDLYSTIGEALVTTALGIDAPAHRNLWLMDANEGQTIEQNREDLMGDLVAICMALILSPRPHERYSSCVWLTVVLAKCSTHRQVLSKLSQIQQSFMMMLNENNDFVQDYASKGLSLVFECAPQELKDDLVNELLGALTEGGTKKRIKLTEDSELFEAGALGKTPDGKNMKTYKELCAIASDLNQPDLIYKFLHLANHQAAWAARRGAAAGVAQLAAKAGKQLEPHLPTLIPRLYRYKFDPSGKVRSAMTAIWDSLVPQSSSTIGQYLRPITEDVLRNLTHNQWRVREGACGALADLLRGRDLTSIVTLIPDLWKTVLLVCDDIKETVRKAAEISLKQLSRSSVKSCEVGGEQEARLVLGALLEHGLQSRLVEGRATSLNTLVKVAHICGPQLKPHVVLLVPALLEALSELEPQALSYLSQRVGAEATEQLDQARVAVTKSSPMMEVLNICVRFLDKDSLPTLVPRLVDLIKHSVGLGTKVGVANFLIQLTVQCPRDLPEFSGKLLGALLHSLGDRNVTVCKAYASAIGHLVKTAKPTSIEKLLSRFKTWYFEKEDPNIRDLCGTCLLSSYTHSTDTISSFGNQALPLAFLAMQKRTNQTPSSSSPSNTWGEVWSQGTTSFDGGVRLYEKELLEICGEALTALSWELKAQGAAGYRTVVEKRGTELTGLSLTNILTTLCDALHGRTWDGKSELLLAVQALCENCATELQSMKPEAEKLIEQLLKESAKENDSKYRLTAVDVVGKVLESLEIDRVVELLDQLEKVVKDDETEINLKLHAITALSSAWPTISYQRPDLGRHRVRMHSTLCVGLSNPTWRLKLASLRALKKYWGKLDLVQNGEIAKDESELIRLLWRVQRQGLAEALLESKYKAVAEAAIDLVENCLKIYAENGIITVVLDGSTKELEKSLNMLLEISTNENRDRISALLKIIEDSRD